MKTFGSLSSSSAKASFRASLTVYVFPASAYPLIEVKAGVILCTGALIVAGLCNRRAAGLNNLDADMVAGGTRSSYFTRGASKIIPRKERVN